MKPTAFSTLLAVTIASVGAALLWPDGATAAEFVLFSAKTNVTPPP